MEGPGSSRRRVYVRGVRSALGWCVADVLRASPELDVVVASGDAPAPSGGFDSIVDVGFADHDLLGRRGESVTAGANDLLDDAIATGVDHLVVVSSAMVYGAFGNNPVPLTEAAVLRPDPTFVYARQLASAEESVERWRSGVDGRRVAMLRPAVPVAESGTSSLARALTAGFGQRFGEDDPAAQFVHHDDVASAVRLAVERCLDGVYNVAPDGSIPGDRVRALSGQRFRLPMPDRLADLVVALRWRFQRGPIPPGLGSYTREPWTVANDLLRAEGWRPGVTNEQAYVEGTEAPWWTMVTPRRRQELALGLVGVGIAGGVGLAVELSRRWWRSRARN
ncbi:MAG: NAD-dependent epimerase/dehydratase family protein [Ilumatobacteraceae bacterium]